MSTQNMGDRGEGIILGLVVYLLSCAKYSLEHCYLQNSLWLLTPALFSSSTKIFPFVYIPECLSSEVRQNTCTFLFFTFFPDGVRKLQISN